MFAIGALSFVIMFRLGLFKWGERARHLAHLYQLRTSTGHDVFPKGVHSCVVSHKLCHLSDTDIREWSNVTTVTFLLFRNIWSSKVLFSYTYTHANARVNAYVRECTCTFVCAHVFEFPCMCMRDDGLQQVV